MDGWTNVGYVLLIAFFITLVFSFVGLIINMLDSCCNESLCYDTDATAPSTEVILNDRMYREESRYRFRYDTPYECGASFREVRDVDIEFLVHSSRYGYPLPTAPKHLPDVSPFSRAASYCSGHSTSHNSRQGSVRLQTTRADVERDISLSHHISPSRHISPSTTIHSSTDNSEEPPPSYDEVVGK